MLLYYIFVVLSRINGVLSFFFVGKWTKEQEADLLQLVEQYGPRWNYLSREYFHRQPDRILSKWRELQPLVNQSNGKLPEAKKRITFSLKDDVQLLTTIRLAIRSKRICWKSDDFGE